MKLQYKSYFAIDTETYQAYNCNERTKARAIRKAKRIKALKNKDFFLTLNLIGVMSMKPKKTDYSMFY